MDSIIDKSQERIVWAGKDITEALKTELRNDLQASVAQGLKNQQVIAKQWQDNVPRMLDGIGEVEMSIDEDLFYASRLVFGEDCWSDPDFRKWVRKNFPETKVKNRSSKIMVGYSGSGNKKCYV